MAYQDAVQAQNQQYTNPSNDMPTPNKYTIGSRRYPADLGAADLQHFVLFNINVRGKSKIDESKRLPNFEISKGEGTANLTNEQLSSNGIRAATYGAAGIEAGVATTALVNGVAKSFNKTGGTGAKVVGVGAGIATAAAMKTSDILAPDKTYRITDAIALYVDGPPTVKYSMNYANKELGTLLGVLSGSTIDSSGAVKGSAEAMAAMGASLAKLPGQFGAADVGAALSKSSGTALNPFKEVVFESVDFRSFAFKYKFYPKSQAEANSVKEIIQTFKEHMHPQMTDSKMFFIYPSEFQITYYFGSSENEYFHKFRPCALESLEVTYGGEQFSTFKDGKPTEINLSMTFRELEILTRESVQKGY